MSWTLIIVLSVFGWMLCGWIFFAAYTYIDWKNGTDLELGTALNRFCISSVCGPAILFIFMFVRIVEYIRDNEFKVVLSGNQSVKVEKKLRGES